MGALLNRRRYMGGSSSNIVLIDGALTPSSSVNMPTDVVSYDEVEIDGGYSINPSGRNDICILCGQRILNSTSQEPLRLYANQGRFRCLRNGNAPSGETMDFLRHTFKVCKTEYSIDGVVKTTYDGSDFAETTYSITLFDNYNHRGNALSNIRGQYIYRATFKKNNVILRNYVPAIENGVYGMYDTVSQQMLFPSSGSLILYEPQNE